MTLIETTPSHPFWVENEWVTADKLKAGDVLTLADGTTCAIDRVYAEFSDKAITVYNFEVADFHSYYVTDTGVLVHNANYSKNHLNKNGTVKANQEYTAGEFGYKYITDGNGNIISANADTLQLKQHKGRYRHKTNTLGKLSGDDAGHLFADQFGGSTDLDNLVSQSSGLNRAVKGKNNYRSMEREWANALKLGIPVTDVNISLFYSKGSNRPSSFNVTYYIDGNYYSRVFYQ